MRIIQLLSLFATLSIWGQKIDYRHFTKQLCAEEFHGRGYVNNGDSIAAQYLAESFKKIGLQPIDGSYFQAYSFPVNTFPGKMLVMTEKDTLVPGKDFLISPNSSGIKGTVYLVQVSPTEFLKKNKNNFLISNNEALLIDYSGLPKDSITLVKNKINEVGDRLPIIEVTDEKLTWSVSQDVQQVFHLIIVKSALKTTPSFIQLDIDQSFISKHAANNVIGYCPAKKKTTKTILLSAHYDHLGRMGKDTYFPGANDNASGNAMLIHLAEQFVKTPAKYNLLFVAFSGEEIGLLGSKHMVANPIIPLRDIRFMLNLDILGSGEEGITVVNSTLFPKEFELLQSINTKNTLLKKIKPRGSAANSDHYYFTAAGVPAFFIYTMGPNKHYHDIEDHYENLSFEAFDSLNSLLLKFIKKIK